MLPTPAAPARRAPFPVVAAVVPVGAAIVMWLVTGSMFMLLFAALGPLIAVATVVDGARAQNRERRRADAEGRAAADRARAQLVQQHSIERAQHWAVLPDAGALVQRPADVWRAAAERDDALVVGRGIGQSRARVVGGGDDADTAALRRSAATLTDVPVSVPAPAGVCVVGPFPPALAVARALVLQLCLAHPPDRLCLVQAPAAEAWTQRLPHVRGRGRRLAFVAPGERVAGDADVVIAIAVPGAPVPRRCAAVLTLRAVPDALLEQGAVRQQVAVEGLSLVQAQALATTLAAAADGALPSPPPPVLLSDLLRESVADARGLRVPVAHDAEGVAAVDLVADGPHAVVAGVTGSGKSELLTTWIAALCATRTPAEVCFLLADFKGGTAFDRLADLPHVTGVLTDLDGGGARRAIESLRAELRRREAELARRGVRDIRDAGGHLPRLVIVVDEFAALVADHPHLHAVFADIAARGRALGMHLVLGAQRIGGVVRDAVLANCPLRISLRVTDPGDSRAVIATDEAARLPGDEDARGLALLRRAGDSTPQIVRIALTEDADLERIRAGAAHGARPHRPWLPALPAHLQLDTLAARIDRPGLILGLADEPERQRQPVVALVPGTDRGLVVVGGPGTGKSAVLDLVMSQAGPGDVHRVGGGTEQAWDALTRLSERPPRGALVLIDDLDAQIAAFPPDYAAMFAGTLERLVRRGGDHELTFVITAQRLSGPTARIAELLPRRALLALPTRLDHVAAGGEAADFDRDAPAGRAMLDGRPLQFALVTGSSVPESADSCGAAPWHPTAELTVVAARSPRMTALSLAAAAGPDCRILQLDELDPGTRAAQLGGVRTVVVGDPDGWQRQWGLWSTVRADGGAVVSTSCAGEFRALSGVRDLPPYARDGDDRAWHIGPSGAVRRIVLPAPER